MESQPFGTLVVSRLLSLFDEIVKRPGLIGEGGLDREAFGLGMLALSFSYPRKDVQRVSVPRVNRLERKLCTLHIEAYAKVSLKKYSPMAARKEDKEVFSGLL